MTSPQEKLLLLKVGDEAPAFEAAFFPQGTFSLCDFREKAIVILAFYPKDDTPGCTAEICAFSDDLEAFRSLGALVFGVSCDSLESHESFAGKYGITVPLISDFEGYVARLYGAKREGHKTANRKLFVIDKKGIIRHIEDGMPDNARLLEIVQSL